MFRKINIKNCEGIDQIPERQQAVVAQWSRALHNCFSSHAEVQVSNLAIAILF